jgi:hypothetical protein
MKIPHEPGWREAAAQRARRRRRTGDQAQRTDAAVADSVAAANSKAVVFQGRKQMPWSPQSFATRHNHNLSGDHSLSGRAASKAADMASAILRRGGSDRVAVATANKKVGDLRKRGLISDRAHSRMKSSGLDRDPDLDAATA